MNVEDVLDYLADGQFHSGEILARRLGVSRTAIWKHVAALADLGVDVERVRGRGYRIAGGVELLAAAAIRDGLDRASVPLLQELQLYRQIDSTNAVLLRGEPPAPGRGRAALAELQTRGRGRRGKLWVSPFARNLYLSLDWLFSGGVSELEGLSLAVGVAVADAIADSGIEGARLKWPNDVLFDGHKLGGILVELSGDAQGPCRAVVGIGLNVAMSASGAAQVDQAWTDLSTVNGGRAPERNRLAAHVLNRCLPLLAAYSRDGFAHWRERWMQRDAFAGHPVTVSSGSSRMAGVARGVDERGSLMLETSTGMRCVSGGEVSLRACS